jgi:hypothetical protein
VHPFVRGDNDAHMRSRSQQRLVIAVVYVHPAFTVTEIRVDPSRPVEVAPPPPAALLPAGPARCIRT